MRQVMLGIVIGVLVAGGFAACGIPDHTHGGEACANDGNCANGYLCVKKVCTSPSTFANQSSLTVSGQRLRARYYKGTDGSRQFAGWWDKDLQKECSFQKASEAIRGVTESEDLYCFSNEIFTPLLINREGSRYLDPECKTPVREVNCGIKVNAPLVVFLSRVPQKTPECPKTGGNIMKHECFIGKKVEITEDMYFKQGDKCKPIEGSAKAHSEAGMSAYVSTGEQCTKENVFSRFVKAETILD